MKASEVIADLKTLIGERGDLEVVNEQDESIHIEFNDDSGEEVFVVS